MYQIRKLRANDQQQTHLLIDSIDVFTSEEKNVAKELVDKNIQDTLDHLNVKSGRNLENMDYQVLVAETNGDGAEAGVGGGKRTIIGHICFGPTPMTAGTFDLYWLTTHPHFRNRGVGKALFEQMVVQLRQINGRLVRTETAGKENYADTRNFYSKIGLQEEARIKNFYFVGDDLVIYTYRI